MQTNDFNKTFGLNMSHTMTNFEKIPSFDLQKY